MKLRLSSRASTILIAAGVALLPTVASALSAAYQWVPNPGSGGTGLLVLNDPAITDPADFGFPFGPIVDDDSIVSLSFTFPVNGLTVTLADFNLQNVANDTAVGPAGWSAVAGQLTTTFNFSGNSPTIQSVRVASAGGPSLNDVIFLEMAGVTEQHTGVWSLVPEPSTALLLVGGLVAIGARRKR